MIIRDHNAVISSLKAAGLIFKDGMVLLPDWCTRVKIDVGLSHDAPQSRRWIESDPNLLVLGFEPIEKNLRRLKENFLANSAYPFQRELDKQLVILPFALGDVPETIDSLMYVTSIDSGCSSLLEPADFEVSEMQAVRLTSLALVLKYFPFEQIRFIDHLKTDAQGSDYEVIKGLGDFVDKIVFITSESENSQYKSSNNSNGALQGFLRGSGFRMFARKKRIFKLLPARVLVDDPTYINLDKFIAVSRSDFFIYQQG